MSLTAKEKQKLKALQSRGANLNDAQLATKRALLAKQAGAGGGGGGSGPGAGDNSGKQFTIVQQGQKPVYIGVAAGSDQELYGTPISTTDPSATTGPMSMTYQAMRKPRYKVGYQNSKDFSAELNGMDPNAIYMYQQRLNAVGMLDKFTPGKLDSATRAAYKELLTQANQNGDTWQSTLQQIEANGGVVKTPKATQPPDAFVSQLDDPQSLREAFQQAAQSLYGGNLPDNEINGMVDAYRHIQQQKQQASYNATLAAANGGVQGSVENIQSPSDFASQEIRAQHPDQVAKVQFQGTLSDALKSLSTTGGGLM